MSTSKRIAKRLIAVILTVMMLMSMVTIGISSVSAASVELAPTGANVSNGTVIYFDNSTFGWTNKVIQLMIGHSSWSQGYQMTKLNGTDLYYVTMPQWDGATQLCVFGADAVWGGENSSISNRKNWAPNSTPIYSLGSNISGTHLLTTTSSALSKTTLSAYSALNTTQTISALVNGEAVTDAATFTASSYNLTSKTASAESSGTTTVSAARTADVTMTAAANEGYTSLGWSTDGTSVTSADATYTYTCDGTAKTVYALFETAAEESSSSSTGEVESQPTTTTPGTSDPEETNGTAMDASAWFTADGLYAYASVATGDELGPDAWQRWDNVSGHSANRYIYLPGSASDTEVVIYNNYSDYVELNGVKIDAGCYAIVPYVNGTTYTTSGATTQTVKIMKSDAEGTIFINSADGMTTKNDAGTKSTVDATYDLYSFLTSGTKNQEAGSAAGAVASANNGVIDYEVDDDGEMIGAASVKKIKGRGNSTWNLSKKPFNITFNKNIEIDGMKGKKWSLLANAQDPSLLRNRLVYDLANEVNMTYACDSRFVDWFVNGDYKGSYQLTQKIEMGKNTVMPDLEEPEVEDITEDDGTITPYPKADFDFILELDTKENAESSGDRGFTTAKGQWMTFKTPDDPADEQYNFMVEKYQAVETALYGGDIAELEKLVNLDDFARAYLINEVAKNLDAGVTSCYFTYNSETGMFTTAPVWDYDNALGNSVSISGRHDADGNMLDVSGPTGWYARDLMHYAISNTLNVFGQACATTTTNAKGETFNDVVLRIWNDEFMPALAVLEGTAEAANGRLDTVAGYMANLKDSGQWNYDYASWDLTANNGWVCDHSSLVMYDYDAEANTYTTSTKSYDQYTLDGQANYAGDWLVSRMNWMAVQYNEAEVVVPDGYITIYFENNWQWPDAKVYYWGSTIGTNPEWNGISLTNVVGQNDQGYDIYEIVIPEDITGLLFNGTGEYGAEQSTDITGGWYEGICYYMTYDSATNTKPCGSYDYKVPEETTTAPAETTTAPAETTTAPTESSPAATSDETTPAETTTAPAETTSAPAEEAETITIYFENNWAWPDAKIYYWGSTTGENPAWEG
ncbi:MAG: CotH kinase family protein, partial [Ruminococcus sp.]|nr:CotH kinase family protein [Ruminococcus sp.]